MRTPHRTAFTLIEVLIVVGIIALLIAVLLPALSTAKELSRRTACAATLRQFADATRSLAIDNNGRFLLTNKHLHPKDTYARSYTDATNSTQKATDHIHWLPPHMVALYKKRFGLDLMQTRCPGMPPEWIRDEADKRISYFLLTGRNQSSFPPENGRVLNFPMKLTDPSEWVIAADIIEQGTETQTAGSGSVGVQTPHGKNGFVSSSDETKFPIEIGSAGGNFAYMDGSVRWEMQDHLVPYYTHVVNGAVGAKWKKGWFPESAGE